VDSPRKLATYDDLLALSEDVKAEVVGGVIDVQPSALPRHSKVQRSLGSLLGGPFDDDDGRGGPGGWWILPEVDTRLSKHDIVRPISPAGSVPACRIRGTPGRSTSCPTGSARSRRPATRVTIGS